MSDSVRLEAVNPDDPNIKLGRVTTTLAAAKRRLGDDPKKPNFECDFHWDQMSRWFMLDSLWDGTEGMRRAGKRLLPRYDQEHQDTWQKRLDNAVLLNYFRKTVQTYVGKPFGRPIEIPDEMPEQIEDCLDDIDGNGMPFDLFAQVGFEKAMCKGIVHALIDFPPCDEDDTAADEASRQPTVCLVQPENLIGAREDEDGCLTQIRIREICTEPDGAFGDKQVVRIRVLEQDKWTVYQQDKDKWIKKSSGINSLGEIPFVTFYVDREGFMRSRPPLLDLAYKNVEHWQSSSDQRNILTICRFPMLYGSGVNPSDPLVIGPNNYFGFRDKDAQLRYVEHGGAAIGAGRQDLEDLKAEMSVLGLALLMPNSSGTATATGKALDSAESITELQRIVLSYEMFLNEVIYWIGRWQSMSEEEACDLPDVKINQDYAKLLSMDSGIQAIMTARGSRDISRKAFIDALKRRNLLPVEFDVEDDQEQLKTEAASSGDGMPPRAGDPAGLLGKPLPYAAESNDPIAGGPARGGAVDPPKGKKRKKIKIERAPDGKVTVGEEE